MKVMNGQQVTTVRRQRRAKPRQGGQSACLKSRKIQGVNWKDNIRHWRGLPAAQQQQFSLARSPMQVWQSMAFEGEPVSLRWLQAQHERLLTTPHVPATSPRSHSMNSDNDAETATKGGGDSASATPSIAALNRLLGTSPAPRMLTPSEIDLLRRSKAEVIQVTREILAAGSAPEN